MNCLLIAATVFEIAPFLDHLKEKKGRLHHADIDVVITGIGLTATAYTITKQLQIKRPDIIIQAGIGGCFDPAIPLGSVVAIKQDMIADLGVIESGQLKTPFDMGLMLPNKFPYTKKWLVNKNEVLKKVKLKKVTAISVNEITTSKQKIRLYQEDFSPVAESMEGAALHYVGLMEHIPFLQIRGLSNYAGERNKKKWKMKEAISNLNNELLQLLPVL